MTRRRGPLPKRPTEHPADAHPAAQHSAAEDSAAAGNDVRRWIGVIDLKAGQAVRAVGGRREQYQPRRTFVFPDGRRVPVDGDPRRLLDGYLGVGVGGIYVADLDGITRGRVQWECLDALAERVGPQTTWFLDPGLTAACWPQRKPAIEALMRRSGGLHLVVATECCENPAWLSRLADQLPRERIVVSLDYRDRRWMSATTTESQWFEACRRDEIRTVIGLDLAAVGSGATGRTEALCRRIRRQLVGVNLISGGGVGDSEDVSKLIAAGADRVLVASLFSDDE